MVWLLHLHGLAAVVALFAGHRMRKALLAGPGSPGKAGLVAWATALFASVAFLFVSGVILYARYRAPDGVRDWLMANSPAWHTTWFEWKEHLGFFALALGGGLWIAAMRKPQEGGRALAVPLLTGLLICLVVSTAVGCILSFLIRSVA